MPRFNNDYLKQQKSMIHHTLKQARHLQAQIRQAPKLALEQQATITAATREIAIDWVSVAQLSPYLPTPTRRHLQGHGNRGAALLFFMLLLSQVAIVQSVRVGNIEINTHALTESDMSKEFPVIDSEYSSLAVDKLKEYADTNDADAQFILYMKLLRPYVKVNGVANYVGTANVEEANTQLIKSVQNGHPYAMYEYAHRLMFANKVRPKQDLVTAYQLFDLAGKSGLQLGRYNAACMKFIGVGVEKDIIAAINTFIELADEEFKLAYEILESLDLDLLVMNRGMLPVGVLATERQKKQFINNEKTTNFFESAWNSFSYSLSLLGTLGVAFSVKQLIPRVELYIKNRRESFAEQERERRKNWELHLNKLTEGLLFKKWEIANDRATLTCELPDIVKLVDPTGKRRLISKDKLMQIIREQIVEKYTGFSVSFEKNDLRIVSDLPRKSWEYDSVKASNAVAHRAIDDEVNKQREALLKSTKTVGSNHKTHQNGTYTANGHAATRIKKKIQENTRMRQSQVVTSPGDFQLEGESQDDQELHENCELQEEQEFQEEQVVQELKEEQSVQELKEEKLAQESQKPAEAKQSILSSSVAVVTRALANHVVEQPLALEQYLNLPSWNQLINFAYCIRSAVQVLEKNSDEYEIQIAWRGMIDWLQMFYIALAACSRDENIAPYIRAEQFVPIQVAISQAIFRYLYFSDRATAAEQLFKFGDIINKILFVDGKPVPFQHIASLVELLYFHANDVVSVASVQPLLTIDKSKEAIKTEFIFMRDLVVKLEENKHNPKDHYRYYSAFFASCLALSGYYSQLVPGLVWRPFLASLSAESLVMRRSVMSKFNLTQWMLLFGEFSYIRSNVANQTVITQLHDSDNTLKTDILFVIKQQFPRMTAELDALFSLQQPQDVYRRANGRRR